MPQATIEERFCCNDDEKVRDKIQDIDLDDPLDSITRDIQCITQHPGLLAVCLNRHTLDAAYSAYKQTYGRYKHCALNKRRRYTAYQQFARWVYGALGKEVR